MFLAAGHENDVMVVIEGTTDEEICMPGNSTINVTHRVYCRHVDSTICTVHTTGYIRICQAQADEVY